jgi:hypothetical protein
MFIAHLPAGYLVSRLLLNALHTPESNRKRFISTGIAASLLPDIDLIYFFLIDHRLHHHHTYWTHLPIFWLSILVIAFGVCLLPKMREWRPPVLVFGANIFLHLALDSVVGDIWWLAPFLNQPYALFSVPARHTPWYLNFLLHWSFWLEIALTAIAYGVWRRTKPYAVQLGFP